MDLHSSSGRSISRKPLSDATQRVNYATVANVGRHQTDVDENFASLKSKHISGGRTNPVVSSIYNPSEQRIPQRVQASTHTTTMGTSAYPKLAVVTRDPRDEARRVSQFSNVSSNASTTRQLKTHIGPWQLGKTLGKGSSARVRLARHRVTQQLVAIKIVAKSTAAITQAGSLANLDRIDYRNPKTREDGGLRRMPLAIEREIAILKLIRHPNIIELLDIWENRSEIYLVTEYVEKGDLFEFINWTGPLCEEEAIFYFRQIMTALDYCHSFNICHRDLKPENILLKSNGQIKIADFGMAALQQGPNHQLRTACGSPHYAAPELLRHQYYKGSAVDIWSMGVILYAMLAGRLPFDENDMATMLAKAKRAEYRMPPHLSAEAKDLIGRILVSQPAHRITMKQMWRHSLIKKYDYLEEYMKWDNQPHYGIRNMAAAPIPEEVDIQILRQLRALWHNYTEEELIEKLRQDKPNDYKMFYWLLYNHREAQLENYNNNVPISKSDYHHLKPPGWVKRVTTCQFTEPGRKGYPRTVSKFTVISTVPDVDETGTVKSYDPFNASRIIHPAQASHAKIIIHRNNQESGFNPSPTVVSHSYRSYKSVNGSFKLHSTASSRRTSSADRLRSPYSTMASIRSQQSSVRVRVANRSKRGVDFSNIRNKGQRHRKNRHNALSAPASNKENRDTTERKPDVTSTSQKQASNRVNIANSMVDVPESATSVFAWTEELEELQQCLVKTCDEAFGNSLLSETTTIGVDTRETSPFTLSFGLLEPTGCANYFTPRAQDARPLPPVPANKASTYSGYNSRLQQSPERRVVSEPAYCDSHNNNNNSSSNVRNLSCVHEDQKDKNDWIKQLKAGRDLVPEPLRTPSSRVNKSYDFLSKAENTIRVVDSPSARGFDFTVEVPKPLNIRKVSPASTAAKSPIAQSHEGAQRRVSYNAQDKHPSVSSHPTESNAKKRVSSWFKRTSKHEESNDSGYGAATESSTRSKDALADLDAPRFDRQGSHSSDSGSDLRAPKKKFNLAFWKWSKNTQAAPRMAIIDDYVDDSEWEDEEEVEEPKYIPPLPRAATTRPGKGKGKKKQDDEPQFTSLWSDSELGYRKIEVQQNWLARLFRVKPAMRYMCFTLSKRRARQELVLLLREWRKYGMKSVDVDKERNIIWAHVGPRNYLNIKEVTFAIEIMTVIEHGTRSFLSIARITQEKGAASSFYKVVEAIYDSFSSRGLLVVDKRKINMMIKTLNS